MKFVARTHIGLIRSSNQDALLLTPALCGVADGMGGHKAGDVASQTTVTKLSQVLCDATPAEDLLRGAIEECNSFVYEMQLSNPDYRGMGTTATILWEEKDAMLLGHVGDSRAYLLRDGCLRQISEDHSLVNEMVQQGVLTKEQARIHPYRNVITRAVGTDPFVKVDVLQIEKKPGDIWLLCSDGLSNEVQDDALAEALKNPDLEKAADALLEMALNAGGHDNISFVIAEVCL